ncbi:MAG: hypothetical protein M3Y17_14015 [Actinomycetota bacterium]|nr:hypothetical protein [Actinomycetota bacterium]
MVTQLAVAYARKPSSADALGVPLRAVHLGDRQQSRAVGVAPRHKAPPPG